MAERILHADDSQSWQRLVSEVVARYSGHQIIAVARNLEEVEKFLLSSDNDFTVAILDADMPNKGDGKIAAAMILTTKPETVIISLSANPQKWGDINLDKGVFDSKELIQILDHLDEFRLHI